MITQKKSASLGDIGKYRSEVYQRLAVEDLTQNDLLERILDYIRNYRELPEDMLNKIIFMTEEKKMIIIREFNRVMDAVKYLI